MGKDYIRYDLLAQEALRGVVRKVLATTAQQGLPGDHHFYISIDTRAPGVVISNRLRGEYPDDMTVILQHQFWDLEVDDEGFSVTLSFGGTPERLVIPYAAIKGFFDPSVQFGLEFVASEETDEDAETGAADADAPEPTGGAQASDAEQAANTPASEQPGDEATDGATIVSLDAFRKKG